MKIFFFVVGLLCGSCALAQQYVISTVAGGAPTPTPVAGVAAAINGQLSVATDASGNVYYGSYDGVFKLSQNGTLTCVAGNSRVGYSGDGGPATTAQLYDFDGLLGITVDGAGNLYIADSGNNRIRKVSPSGIITTIAGNGTESYSGDGGPASIAGVRTPAAVAVDGGGNLYIAEPGDNRIRKVSPNGIITTIAGNGTGGYSGDGGPATSAQLSEPVGVTVDGAGNLYIAEFGDARIRKVSPAGVITTVAGNGTAGYSGDGGLATAAELSRPIFGVAVDNSGNLYIADQGNERIRKVSSAGIIATVAGNGTRGFSGDGGPATGASLLTPTGVSVDSTGNLYIADTSNSRIRKVAKGGIITTVAGDGTASYLGDGGSATSAQLASPAGVAVDGTGNLYIADSYNNRVRKVSPAGIITTMAGNGTAIGCCVPLGDGGPATNAQLFYPGGVAVDVADNLYIADTYDNRVRKVSPNGIITTVAGGGSNGLGDGGPAISAQLMLAQNQNPPADLANGLAVDSGGNLYIADTYNYLIRKVSPGGTITTVAGNGTSGYSGDSGPATSAQLWEPRGVAVDGAGNVYIADGNALIRKVSPSGTITTVAGMAGISTSCYPCDGGPATSADLRIPTGVAVDGAGNLYIADYGNDIVRKVSTAGIITTIAGNLRTGTSCCYSGDGGAAIDAGLYSPLGIAVNSAGQVYVADSGNNAIRMLQPTNQGVLIGAVVDAASENPTPVSPGKIVVVYGAGLGPAALIQNQPANGAFGSQIGGTAVYFNGEAAPILYASAAQVAAIVPYAIVGSPTAQVTVSYQGQVSSAFTVPVAASAPSFFSLNGTGAGQAAAVNVDGSINDAAHPVKIGGYVSIFATGEGQTSPAGIDGKLASTQPYPQPVLPVKVTVGGLPATVTYAGAAPTEVAGLMQIVVQIPNGVQPGGYVPVDFRSGMRRR